MRPSECELRVREWFCQYTPRLAIGESQDRGRTVQVLACEMVKFARAVIVDDDDQTIPGDGFDLKLSSYAGKKHFADSGHERLAFALLKIVPEANCSGVGYNKIAIVCWCDPYLQDGSAVAGPPVWRQVHNRLLRMSEATKAP